MDYLLYSRPTCVTGRRLAQYLGVEHGTEGPQARPDVMIRWGSSQPVKYKPANRCLNTRAAIERTISKPRTFAVLQAAHIPVPRFAVTTAGLTYPLVARKDKTQGGEGIRLLMQPGDTQHLDFRPDFYCEYIQKAREFRVHIINGLRVKIQEKIFRGDQKLYDPVVWNFERGWVFNQPRDAHPGLALASAAIQALKLDFGAVDIVIDTDDRPWVLEVNSAPGLIDENLILYGDAIAHSIGLEPNGPGEVEPIPQWDLEEGEDFNG